MESAVLDHTAYEGDLYRDAVRHIEGLPWCVLVTTGRVGSDLLQSLLDSHPQIFGFNGFLPFHEFWKHSRCATYRGEIEPQHLAYEIVGSFIHMFQSRYDLTEAKDRLGADRNRSLQLDLSTLVRHLTHLAALRPINSRNVLQALYLAYSMTLGEDRSAKRLVFHHLHHIWNLKDFLADFPESKIISMTRDPRATYVSGVEHWRRFDPSFADNPAYVLLVLRRVVEDAREVTRYPNDHLVVRLEDLGNVAVLKRLAMWLGVDYHPCMLESSWGGLRWWGDRLSETIPESWERGFSPRVAANGWEQKLGRRDQFLFNYLLHRRLKTYRYPHSSKLTLPAHVLAPFAILLPFGYERRFLKWNYLWSSIRQGRGRPVLTLIGAYLRRVRLFYRTYFEEWRGRTKLPPVLGVEDAVEAAPALVRH